MDKIASRKMERKYQEQIRTLAEELNEVKGRLEVKDGTLRVLEKQIRGKNEFIDELRGRIEGLVREKVSSRRRMLLLLLLLLPQPHVHMLTLILRAALLFAQLHPLHQVQFLQLRGPSHRLPQRRQRGRP